jgi:hypothetical protein
MSVNEGTSMVSPNRPKFLTTSGVIVRFEVMGMASSSYPWWIPSKVQ